MRLFLLNLFRFIGFGLILAFLGVLFAFGADRYFFIAGKWRDLSLYAFAGLIILWGMAFLRWKRYKKYELLVFCGCLSLVCMAFEWWTLFVLASDEVYKWQFWGLIGASAAGGLAFLYKKQVNMVLLMGACCFIIFFGAAFLFADRVTIIACGLFLAVFILGEAARWLIYHKKAMGKAFFHAAYITFFLIFLLGGFYFYSQAPGIKFYERKVAQSIGAVKVSVVVPVYNGEKTIKRCLDSIRRQSLKEIEIIVVNDGSTDRTLEILKEYADHDGRIKVISQENAYSGAARNRGMAEARGEYIGFVDADDFVSLKYYEQLFNAAKKQDADIAIAYNVFRVTNISPLVYKPYFAREAFVMEDTIFDLAAFRREIFGYLWDKIYRRQFLKAHHILGTTLRTTAEDNYFTTLALMYADKMAVAKGAIYYYFIPSKKLSLTSVSSFKQDDKVIEMFLALEEAIETADIEEDKKAVWLKVAQNVREVCFYTWWWASRKELRDDIMARCNAAFPQDKFDFNKKQGDN